MSPILFLFSPVPTEGAELVVFTFYFVLTCLILVAGEPGLIFGAKHILSFLPQGEPLRREYTLH